LALSCLSEVIEPNVPGYPFIRTEMTTASGKDEQDQGRTRIDKWLWAARFCKTRSVAAQAVEGGKVKLNDERVKAAKTVRVGDRMTVRIGEHEWSITVQALSERRGPAEVARTLYHEDDKSREARMAAIENKRGELDPQPVHGGRPEKRQRRELRRVRGY